MKRKFKQWWSTIPLISTKRTATSNLKPFNTELFRTFTAYELSFTINMKRGTSVKISIYKLLFSREANVSFRNSSHKAKNIYARADNNNPPGVAHNRNKYWRLFTMTITE
jgi:hypothetical protein